MVTKYFIYLQDNIYFQQCCLIFLNATRLLLGVFLKFIFNQKEKHSLILTKYSTFYFNKIRFFIQKNRCYSKTVVSEFQKYKKDITLNFSQIFKKTPEKDSTFSNVAGLQPAALLKHELFHRYFSSILRTFWENLFKETPLNVLCFQLFQ